MPTSLFCPGGYHLLSDLHKIERGEHIRRSKGFTRKLDVSGNLLFEQADVLKAAPTVAALVDSSPNWVADVYWENTTGNPIRLFNTSWIVPQPPPTVCGQIIYLFNGMDPVASENAILQPVLQWGVGPAGGGAFWSIASYYVIKDGPALSTDAVKVNPGDLMQASIRLESSDSNGFNYIAEFIGHPETALRASSVNELVWCYETLETYGASSSNACYPASPGTAFKSILINTISAAGAAVPLIPPVTWKVETGGSNNGQYVIPIINSANNGEIDIYYR